jgi:hypothetical protein
VEDIISGLEDKIGIKEKKKTEELLDKRLKSYEMNTLEYSHSIKRPNLLIICIKGREEVQTKGTHNIFNKIIEENFPSFEKELSIQVQEASRTPTELGQNRTSPRHIITK